MFAPAPKVNAQILSSSSPLTNKRGHWWNDRGLRTLNFLIFIPLMSEYVQGYDASLINNVQQLKSWQTGKFGFLAISPYLMTELVFLSCFLNPDQS
jgi:hypothetical protein